MLRNDLFDTLLWLLIMVFGLFVMNWGIFFSIKYSGNLGFGFKMSKTTMASAWDKSKMAPMSFMDQSIIIEEDKDSIFEKEEEEDVDVYFTTSKEESMDSNIY